jgi:hypothetical protein
VSASKYRAALSVFALVLPLGVGACGGSSDGDISDGARAALAPLVAGVRSAAESLDPAGAAHALGDVRQEVERLRASGALGEERARAILANAARVESRLALIPTPTITTTTTAPTTVPSPTPDTKGPKDESKDDAKGKGSGKGP